MKNSRDACLLTSWLGKEWNCYFPAHSWLVISHGEGQGTSRTKTFNFPPWVDYSDGWFCDLEDSPPEKQFLKGRIRKTCDVAKNFMAIYRG